MEQKDSDTTSQTFKKSKLLVNLPVYKKEQELLEEFIWQNLEIPADFMH